MYGVYVVLTPKWAPKSDRTIGTISMSTPLPHHHPHIYATTRLATIAVTNTRLIIEKIKIKNKHNNKWGRNIPPRRSTSSSSFFFHQTLIINTNTASSTTTPSSINTFMHHHLPPISTHYQETREFTPSPSIPLISCTPV